MPRQYTQRAHIGGNLANAEDWNGEISTAVSEINGQLDQNNMPLDSVNDTKMKPATVVVDVDNTAVAKDFIAHTYMQSQSYHVSSSCIGEGFENNFYKDEWTKTDWQLGWMKLSEKRNITIGPTTYYSGAEVSFEAQEGMILGEIFVDVDWRTSYWGRSNDVGTSALLRDKNYVELGVFINDVCCARTDLQWHGGRYTYVLPYSTPIGSTPVTIDIRFRINFKNDPPGIGYIVTEDWIESFYVWDSGLWARNQYR
jgi:hypothetical protein